MFFDYALELRGAVDHPVYLYPGRAVGFVSFVGFLSAPFTRRGALVFAQGVVHGLESATESGLLDPGTEREARIADTFEQTP